MRAFSLMCVVLWTVLAVFLGSPATAQPLVLVQDGVSLAPVVVYENAPLLTRQAANDLAEYIEKTTGAMPEIIEGRPTRVPDRAIWVGYQPVLEELFPKIDFDFKHPEEILIAANEKHLVIAGRDIWDPENPVGKNRKGGPLPGVQREYGTCNAVYTFLRDYLEVRWLWPGELGEDIAEKGTVSFEPFEYRYHPQIRMRSGILRFSAFDYGGSPYGHSLEWTRFQRLQLDSLRGNAGGHGFGGWWDRFHEAHPEYFALQPDGTRTLCTLPKRVKLCHSNPDVWMQWLADAEEQIRESPNVTLINASPNDGGNSGHCVCERCRSWDHPDATKLWFRWAGEGREDVAISDRQVIFANKVAALLRGKYPDRDYRVLMLAYGNWRPAPVGAIPDKNVVISNVANIFWNLKSKNPDGSSRAEQFAGWAAKSGKQIWRPNTGNPAGWMNGLPDVPIGRVMESFKFVADHGCVGVYIDSVWEQWATQGPLYYAMAHVAWDPSVDWRTVMDDYYRRGFGPAAGEMKAYWTLLEEARNRKVDDYPGEGAGYMEVYNQAFFNKAYGLLDRAAQKAAGAAEKYRERIEFNRVGLDHTRMVSELRGLSAELLLANGKDADVAQRTRAKWEEIQGNCEKFPHALSWMALRPSRRMTRGGLFHPDSVDSAKSKHVAQWKSAAAEKAPRETVALRAAEESGWELVFSDDFERDTLGDEWSIVGGRWSVRDGVLRGMGTLVSSKGFPGEGAAGFQRMEFEASAEPGSARVSDMSSLLHVKQAEENPDPLKHGYFFQFGGRWNTSNRIAKAGETLVLRENPETRIAPDKAHKIVVQNDRGRMAMFVDGVNVLTANEDSSILGEGNDRVGFFFYSGFRIHNVKVYVKPIASGLDEDADEVN